MLVKKQRDAESAAVAADKVSRCTMHWSIS